MNRLSILFLSSWYPNEILSQNGNFVQKHARAVSIYCNVAVLHVQGKVQKENTKVTKRYNKDVYEVIVYYKRLKSTSLLSSFFKKKIQHKAFDEGYAQVLKELKAIDLVHLNIVLPAGFFALYLKKSFNIPFIVTEHSTVFLDSNPSNHNFVEKYFVKKITKEAKFICPVSTDLKNEMINYGIIGEFVVIPNVVNTRIFYFNKKKTIEKINILHVSTLNNDHKNIKGIINVIKELSKTRTDFIFQVIGDGNIKNMEKYANEVKLEKQFFNFQEEKPSEEIAKAMQSSHLFILFSNYENLPCVISEALVSGVPVLSSNVGGINEMISTKNGVLVNSGNEYELLNKLDFMLNSLSDYDGERIAKEAALIYSYETVGKKYLELYKKTVEFE